MIPDLRNPRWTDVLQGRHTPQFEFIGARMLLVRLRMVLTRDPSPGSLVRCCIELRELFAHNIGLQSVQNDLKKLEAKE